MASLEDKDDVADGVALLSAALLLVSPHATRANAEPAKIRSKLFLMINDLENAPIIHF